MTTSIENLLLQAWERRQVRVHTDGLEAFRLVCEDADGCPGLSIDDFAGFFFVQIKATKWNAISWDKALRTVASAIHPKTNFRIFVAENDLKAGFRWLSGKKAGTTVTEADLKFEILLGEGRHPGFFLDQRDNRTRVRKVASGKRVLNLFCHTGAFTLAALRGGAREAHSVDLSRNYLDWLERNLELNGLKSPASRVFAADAFDFLEGGRDPYDLIVVDPPSFSRGKGSTFSADKDLEKLLSAAAGRLAPGGRILASLNTQGLSSRNFATRVKAAMQPFGLKLLESFGLPFDFGGTAPAADPYLKSCWIGSKG